jgi:hypothetical protein
MSYDDEWWEPEEEEPVTRDAIDMMKMQLALAVKKGVYLLDEQFPEWRQKIDLDSLELSSGHCCVLGQLYGYYSWGQRQLGLDNPSMFGFEVPSENVEYQRSLAYDALNELWAEHINEA